MSGFFVDDSPKEDTIPFGGTMVRARIDQTGLFMIQFPTQAHGLMSIRAHFDQVRHIGMNETPAPAASVETSTPVPQGHIAGPPSPGPFSAASAPAAAQAAPAAPVKRGRGRPRKVVAQV